jgi:heme exporter protein D
VTWQVLAVAITALAVLAFTIYTTGTLFRGLVRQQARERELLLNQIMHLAGRTWQQPPAVAELASFDDTIVSYIDPSQLPDE